MRLVWLFVIAAGCGSSGNPVPSPAAADTTPRTPHAPSPPEPPLIVLDGEPGAFAAARAALEQAGFRVADGQAMADAVRATWVFANLEAPLPPALPAEVAPHWRAAAEACRAYRNKCPWLQPDDPDCEQLLQCTQHAVPALREAWLRALGADAWIEVVIGPTERDEGVPHAASDFFAKAWGHQLCEPQMRELRVGAESDIMSVGSAAPLPETLADAATTAGALAVQIARGDGEPTERAFAPRVEVPSDPAEVAKLLGCAR